MKKINLDHMFIANVLLIITIVISGLMIFFTVNAPVKTEPLTEFYLLNSQKSAENYPRNLTLGETISLIIGVSNHENRQMNYVIESYLINQTSNETDNSNTIETMELINKYEVSLIPNEIKEIEFTHIVKDISFNKLEFLLFISPEPSTEKMGQDRINMSYRELYLWINQ